MYKILDLKAGDSVMWFEGCSPLHGTIINIKGDFARIKRRGEVYRIELKKLYYN